MSLERGPNELAMKENNGVTERYWRRATNSKYLETVEEYDNGKQLLEKDPTLVSLYEYAMKFETN